MNVFSKVFIASALAFTSLSSHAVAQEVLSVTAESLYGEFESNQLKAEHKYKDTAFNIKGTIDSVSKNGEGEVYIELNGDKFPVPVVKAYLTEQAVGKAIDFDKGDEVTLHCISADKPSMVYAHSCDVVE